MNPGQKIMNYFIPPDIIGNQETYAKAKLMVNAYYLAIGMSMCSALLSATIYANIPTQFNPYIVLVLGIGGLFLFKQYGNFIVTGNILPTITALALGPLSMTSGGIYSMDYIFMLIIPIIAFLFAGRRSGVIWSLLLLMFGGFLYYLEGNSEISYILQTKDFDHHYYFIVSIFLFMVVLGSVLLYEINKTAVLRNLEESRKELEEKTAKLVKQEKSLISSNQELEEKTAKLIAQEGSLKSSNQELKEKTAKLVKQERSLKSSNQELEDYAKVVSHDLKEPLRNINTYSHLLIRSMQKQGWQNEEINEHLQSINQNIKNMDQMIKDLLEYSRLDNKNRKEEFTAMDLKDVIYIVSQNLNQQLTSNQVEIFAESLPDELHIIPIKMIQLFQNLISNAIKFRNQEKPCRIDIKVDKTDQHWKISIQDNGIGISKENQEKVFQLFQRLHAKSEYEGSGIGLATCKKIVELHQGDIWVESELSKGSTFHFTILDDLNQQSDN